MKGMICVLMAGVFLCACQPGGRSQQDSKLIRENEHRLASLEESVTALNSQIAQLNNRVYEVRTKTGQKTSMTVVPVTRAEPAPAARVEVAEPVPAQSPRPTPTAAPAKPARKAQPVGRKIDPAAKPGPLPTRAAQAAPQPAAQPAPQAAPASGSIGVPQNAGASGKEVIGPAVDVALPPASLPSETVPVPQGNVTPQLPPMEESPSIPLPLSPEISLPSEQPVQAPQSAAPAAVPVAKKSAAKPAQGEQAAYNAALSAARSGRTAEGIRLFRDFLQKYPNGRYAANAEYWIGECLYSQGKYKDALSEFQSVNNTYPSHHKNADALLKAGLTMSKMGDKDGAAEKFRTLIANFPNSEAARRARAMGAN